eukprot:GILK01013562.1.p1 GENE.GILK01013562.1~~GILK01013562.1.p1  ORF type:complete len:607 (+),score=104.85 GILK01013562.1:30-1823(+)
MATFERRPEDDDIMRESHVVDVSSNVEGCEGMNLVEPDPQCLWLSSQGLPQHVTFELPHRELTAACLGWLCWHAYSTNPSGVHVSVSANGVTFTLLSRLQGAFYAGLQLHRLPPFSLLHYRYLRMTIISAHGADQTYMNQVFLWEHDASTVLHSLQSQGLDAMLVDPANAKDPPIQRNNKDTNNRDLSSSNNSTHASSNMKMADHMSMSAISAPSSVSLVNHPSPSAGSILKKTASSPTVTTKHQQQEIMEAESLLSQLNRQLTQVQAEVNHLANQSNSSFYSPSSSSSAPPLIYDPLMIPSEPFRSLVTSDIPTDTEKKLIEAQSQVQHLTTILDSTLNRLETTISDLSSGFSMLSNRVSALERSIPKAIVDTQSQLVHETVQRVHAELQRDGLNVTDLKSQVKSLVDSTISSHTKSSEAVPYITRKELTSFEKELMAMTIEPALNEQIQAVHKRVDVLLNRQTETQQQELHRLQRSLEERVNTHFSNVDSQMHSRFGEIQKRADSLLAELHATSKPGSSVNSSMSSPNTVSNRLNQAKILEEQKKIEEISAKLQQKFAEKARKLQILRTDGEERQGEPRVLFRQPFVTATDEAKY